MAVYFLVAEQLNAVKIGRAYRVDARISSIQSGCPVPLKCVKVVKPRRPQNDATLEGEFHERFKSYRTRGEWFSLTGDLKDFLNHGLKEDLIQCDSFVRQVTENLWTVHIQFYCLFHNHGRYYKNYYLKKVQGTQQDAEEMLGQKLKLFASQASRREFVESKNTRETLRNLYQEVNI